MKGFFRAAALMALVLVTSCGERRQVQRTVNIVSWGSQFQADLMAEYVQPEAKRLGIELRPEAWDGAYPTLTTRIERGLNTWDIVHVEAHYVLTDKKPDLFHKVAGRNLSSVAPGLRRDPFLRAALEEGYAVPLLEYGYVVAGRADKLGRPVTGLTWKDFWDVRSLPGRRGMRDFPVGNIEAALASLGHDPVEYLYKEADPASLRAKVEEAFDRLEQLAPHISWWKTGEQLQQGLETGNMPLAAAWSGRVWSSYRTLCGDDRDVNKCEVGLSPATALISTDWWIIPKNAPNAASAEALLQGLISAGAAPGARGFSARQGYAVPLVGADVSDPVAKHFLRAGSSDNDRKLARINEQFWGENYSWIDKRWGEFVLRNQRR